MITDDIIGIVVNINFSIKYNVESNSFLILYCFAMIIIMLINLKNNDYLRKCDAIVINI